MIEGVLRMSKWQIRDVMLPKNDIVGVNISDDYDTVWGVVCEWQHSRYPVLIKTASMSGAFFWLRTCCTTAIKDMISL